MSTSEAEARKMREEEIPKIYQGSYKRGFREGIRIFLLTSNIRIFDRCAG